MPHDAQSQPALIKSLNWEPIFNSPPDVAEGRQDLTIDHSLDGHAQSHPAVYVRKPMDFVRGASATSVAMNGSVKLNGDRMARAAENVARWKMYLPEECVRAMMKAGWHWST
jgi:hypothetical protein